MSEISLKFRLTTEDVAEYTNVIAGKGSKLLRFILCAITVYFIADNIISEDGSYVFAALLIIFVLLIILRPFIDGKINMKRMNKYYALKTDISVEFFEDHIVEKNIGGETKIEFENHFPLEAITNIVETDKQYAFFVSAMEAIIIPKRVMSEEDKQKIKNLIDNLFSDKYIKS